jgi:Ca2+-binding EF-hand superfamily protein
MESSGTLPWWWIFKHYLKLIVLVLGCCPSEAEIQEILVEVEDEETSGSVRLDRFLSTVSRIIQERRFVSKQAFVKPSVLDDLKDLNILRIDQMS